MDPFVKIWILKKVSWIKGRVHSPVTLYSWGGTWKISFFFLFFAFCWWKIRQIFYFFVMVALLPTVPFIEKCWFWNVVLSCFIFAFIVSIFLSRTPFSPVSLTLTTFIPFHWCQLDWWLAQEKKEWRWRKVKRMRKGKLRRKKKIIHGSIL